MNIKDIVAIYNEVNPDITSYEDIDFVLDGIKRDIQNSYLTENTARNGRKVLWYYDDIHNAAIYMDTHETLSDEEIESQLC